MGEFEEQVRPMRGGDPLILRVTSPIIGAELYVMSASRRDDAVASRKSDDEFMQRAIKLEEVDTLALAQQIERNGYVDLVFTDGWLRHHGFIDERGAPNNAVLELRQYRPGSDFKLMSAKGACPGVWSEPVFAAINHPSFGQGIHTVQTGNRGRTTQEQISLVNPIIISHGDELPRVTNFFRKHPDARPPEAHPGRFEQCVQEQGADKTSEVVVKGDLEPYAKMVLRNYALEDDPNFKKIGISEPVEASHDPATAGMIQGSVRAKDGEPIIIQLTDPTTDLQLQDRTGNQTLYPTQFRAPLHQERTKVMTFVAGRKSEPVIVPHPQHGELTGPPRLVAKQLGIDEHGGLVCKGAIEPGYLVEIFNQNAKGEKRFRSAADAAGSLYRQADIYEGDVFAVKVIHPTQRDWTTTAFFRAERCDDQVVPVLLEGAGRGDWERVKSMTTKIKPSKNVDSVPLAQQPIVLPEFKLTAVSPSASPHPYGLNLQGSSPVELHNASVTVNTRAVLDQEKATLTITVDPYRTGGYTTSSKAKPTQVVAELQTALASAVQRPNTGAVNADLDLKVNIVDIAGQRLGSGTARYQTQKGFTNWSLTF